MQSIDFILAWADAWKQRTGRYPSAMSGSVPEAQGLTWAAIDRGLRYGSYRLPMGSSLLRLLQERRGKKHYEKRGSSAAGHAKPQRATEH